MTVKMLGVEEGIERVKEMIPDVHITEGKNIKLSGATEDGIKISIGDAGEFVLPKFAQKRFHTRMKIDFPMLCELTPDVQAQCWQQLVQNVNKPFRFHTVQGEIVQIKGTDQPVPNYKGMVNRLAEVCKPIGFANLTRRGDHVGFGMVTNVAETPPKKVGDNIHLGIYGSFNGDARVAPFNLRLVCINGMVSVKRNKAWVLSEDNFEETLQRAQDWSHKVLKDFVRLDEHPARNVGGLVGRLSRQRILNPTQVRQITEELATLGDDATEYDLINLITQLQHDRPNDLSWLYAGGRSVDYLHNDHCDKCGAAL